jgi:hypothetical protein
MGRPQEVINGQIGEYDIFVGIMWKRFGTPTGMAQSGTEEEFRLAYDAWQQSKSPSILFYFCQEPFMPSCAGEAEQCRDVLSFRDELEKKGLIWKYDTHDTFSDTIRPHLTRMLLDNEARIASAAGSDSDVEDLRFTPYLER